VVYVTACFNARSGIIVSGVFKNKKECKTKQKGLEKLEGLSPPFSSPPSPGVARVAWLKNKK
jgi:hypothetical protein